IHRASKSDLCAATIKENIHHHVSARFQSSIVNCAIRQSQCAVHDQRVAATQALREPRIDIKYQVVESLCHRHIDSPIAAVNYYRRRIVVEGAGAVSEI